MVNALVFEVKYTNAPKITKSMRIALEDLKLDRLIILFPGKDIFPLTETILACGIETIGNPDLIHNYLAQK